ncbi:MAG: BON domain-containing protein [Candidatus Saccharibacteria bacterium]|nr:BON domain-containing protein [Pseudorhodobacter sp.]
MHWHWHHDAAADAVRRLWDATGISNQIAIKPMADARRIKSDVMVALNRSWFIQENIYVSAYDGKVTLTGTVEHWNKRARVGTTA